MIQISSTNENLSDFFGIWVNIYDYNRYPDFKAVYQFVLKENEETYFFYVQIADGKAIYAQGKHNNPSITIYSTISTWFDIASGKLNGFWGWVTKKYRIDGQLYYLKMMNKVFSKKLCNDEVPGIDDKILDFEIPKKRKWKKPDKVLIINGSPRKKNGATYFYLNHFMKGIEKSNTEVEVIDVYDNNLKIEPCRGCFVCWVKTNGKCVIKDDANALIDKINSSYLTIYAFPLYIDSTPAKVKTLLDRIFINVAPVFVPYKNLTRHPLREPKERYMVLFSVCGFPEMKHFDPIIDTFKSMARNSHTPLLATILRPGGISFINSPPYRYYLQEILLSLEKAGSELVEKGEISKKRLKSISSNCGISKKLWRTYANYFWFLKKESSKNE
ncbi:MAG: flavodoxin family protein [Endomicrobiia bacterium]